ncbi:hypothetical protein AaE_008340, partial [Aphanomyces astaci]
IAPAYFVFFYIVLVLVVVNIFVAILQDAFTTAHKKQTALKTKQPAVGFPFAAGVWPTVVFYIKRQWVAVKYGAGAAAKLAMPSDTKGATPTLGAPCTRTWPWKCKRSVKKLTTMMRAHMAMEMQALSEKLTTMMRAHDEKRGKLDNNEAMLR